MSNVPITTPHYFPSSTLAHIYFFCFSGQSITSQGEIPEEYALLPSTCTAYSLSQLQQATVGWSDTNLLGRGGFGEVYRGVDPKNPSVDVAVKRATVQTTKFREEVSNQFLVCLSHGLCVSKRLSFMLA